MMDTTESMTEFVAKSEMIVSQVLAQLQQCLYNQQELAVAVILLLFGGIGGMMVDR